MTDRISSLKEGDRVRLLRDRSDITGADAKAGEAGTLGRLYRVQQMGGPYEVWELVLDRTWRPLGAEGGNAVRRRVCVSHMDIEVIP
jgi:hypothetical protein